MLAAASSKVAATANLVGNGHLLGGDRGNGNAPLADATTECNMELISALAALQEERRRRETGFTLLISHAAVNEAALCLS